LRRRGEVVTVCYEGGGLRRGLRVEYSRSMSDKPWSIEPQRDEPSEARPEEKVKTGFQPPEADHVSGDSEPDDDSDSAGS
jgi:hypothetical protein